MYAKFQSSLYTSPKNGYKTMNNSLTAVQTFFKFWLFLRIVNNWDLEGAMKLILVSIDLS